MANVRSASSSTGRTETWRPDRFPQLLRRYYVLLEREVFRPCVLVDYSSAPSFTVSFQTWRPPGIDTGGGGAWTSAPIYCTGSNEIMAEVD
jgi:hypothetical protein